MPGFNREAALAALVTRLGTVSGLSGKVYRRMPPGTPPVPAEQPCAFVACDKETPKRTPRGSTVWTLSLFVVIYNRTDDDTVAPATTLATIVGNIETALQMQAGDRRIDQGSPTTLGNTCESCDMGAVEYGEGIVDGQGVAFIPVTIIGASTP